MLENLQLLIRNICMQFCAMLYTFMHSMRAMLFYLVQMRENACLHNTLCCYSVNKRNLMEFTAVGFQILISQCHQRNDFTRSESNKESSFRFQILNSI